MNLRDDNAVVQQVPLHTQPDWASLLAGTSRQAIAEAWLGWLWPQLPNPQRAVVLFDDEQTALNAVASLPQGQALTHLEPWIRQSVTGEQALMQADTLRPGSPWVVVQPAVVSGRVRVAVCAELNVSQPAEASSALATMQWGLGWLAAALLSGEQGHSGRHLERSRLLFDLALAALSQPKFDEAALAVVNGLAKRYQASMVQLGWLERQSISIDARSNTAWHDAKSALVLQAEQAMNEAVDQQRNVHLVIAELGAASAVDAPLTYAREAGVAALAIVLLYAHEHIVGALMLERERAFSADELKSLEAKALLLGPLLDLKHASQRGLWAHARERSNALLRALTDASRPGLKLVLSAALALLIVAAFVPVTFRVTAPSIIEGEVQRAAVAPFQGFIREAQVRAGDTFKRGQVLAQLEDKDLQLEKVRWEAELEVALRKEREALASGNRVDQRLASAQANQARAQLDLTQYKLERVQITAPFDGVVVRGDLSQQLGSPVEQGNLLFELAPLDSWRVILKVDERDIAHVRPGQDGEIVLASLPGEAQPLKVKRVTSVAVAEEGRNFFRVEADLVQKSAPLRPGMEGVAKIATDQRSLLWVWTHRLVDWLRITYWEWRP